MDLPQFLCIQAYANRLSNHRLHEAMRGLSREQFHAPRTSFFPSLALTLNHILEVDLFYVAVLYREPGLRSFFDTFVP
ncbi:MAG: DinB family protein, partial [Pseudomonadota bacterium]